MRPAPALALALALLACAPARAIDLLLGPPEIERALTLGRAPESERARFHAPYVVALHDATAERLEVITEFRRIVLAQENRILHGDHMFSARQAVETTAPWRGKVTLVLHLRFHPQNVLMRVPAYDVTVGQPALPTLDVRRTPLYAIQPPGRKSGTAVPLFGGLVESDVDAAGIRQTARAVVVSLEGREIARAAIEFGALR